MSIFTLNHTLSFEIHAQNLIVVILFWPKTTVFQSNGGLQAHHSSSSFYPYSGSLFYVQISTKEEHCIYLPSRLLRTMGDI